MPEILIVPTKEEILKRLGYEDDLVEDPIEPGLFHPKPKKDNSQIEPTE